MIPSASLLLVSLLGLVVEAAPGEAAFEFQVQRASPRHARVVQAPRPTPDATITILFPVGAVDDGVASGLTRLSQHALLQSNEAENCAAFHKDIYATASTLTLHTGIRESSISLTARREHFTGLAQRLLRLVLTPKLTAKGLSRARSLTLNDERGGDGVEGFLGFIASSVMLTQSGVEGGDYNSPPYGDPQVVRDLRLPDVAKYVRAKLAPANATVILTGSYDAGPLLKVVANAKGGQPVRPLRRPDLARQLPLHFEKGGPREMHVEMLLVDLKSPRQVAAAHLLPSVLNERIMWRLRREGVTYSTLTVPVVQEWLDFVVMVVPVANAQDLRVDEMLRQLVASTREGNLSDEEYLRDRAAVLAEMTLADARSAPLARELAVGQGRVAWHDAAVARELAGLGKQEFLDTVRPWLADNATVDFRFGRRDAYGGRP